MACQRRHWVTSLAPRAYSSSGLMRIFDDAYEKWFFSVPLEYRLVYYKTNKKKKEKDKNGIRNASHHFYKILFRIKKKYIYTWQKVTLFIIFTIESIIRKKLDENFPQRVKKKRKKKTKARNRLGKNKYSGKE